MLTRFLYYLFSILFLLGVAILAGYLIFPEQSAEFWWNMRRAGHEFWYGKDLHYHGLSMLQSEDLEVKLPMDASVLWWNLHTSQIESRIRAHPLVQEAYVQHCDKTVSMRCFDVIVIERKPHYLVDLGTQRWAVGDDGGFITPTPETASLPNTITITGLGDSQTSPDVVRARFQQLRKALRTIEGQAELPIDTAQFEPNLEFTVRFKDLPFSVRFDLSNDGQFVPQESRRLKKLLNEFEGKIEMIKSVDLAYNKLAVVQVNQANQGKTGSQAAK